MRSLSDYVNEDTNQFGPGTDLIVAILAVLLVISLISSYLYSETSRLYLETQRQLSDSEAQRRLAKNAATETFRLADQSFPAGDFQSRPVTKLIDPAQTDRRVKEIVRDYRQSKATFPYIFVIGHSNALDDPGATDHSRVARLQRNSEYAWRRSGIVASLIQEDLTEQERDRVVVTATGEFDLRAPGQPLSQDNAWVEVVFGRAWKPPARTHPR